MKNVFHWVMDRNGVLRLGHVNGNSDIEDVIGLHDVAWGDKEVSLVTYDEEDNEVLDSISITPDYIPSDVISEIIFRISNSQANFNNHNTVHVFQSFSLLGEMIFEYLSADDEKCFKPGYRNKEVFLFSTLTNEDGSVQLTFRSLKNTYTFPYERLNPKELVLKLDENIEKNR